MVPQVEFLGHVVSAKGITPNADKVQVIRGLKTPSTVREVHSFLGMASYYRKFLHHFSEIAGPLIHLTRKHARFKWSAECEKAFQELKARLCEASLCTSPSGFVKTISSVY